MKKITCILTVIAMSMFMIFTTVGCNSSGGDNSSANNSQNSEDKKSYIFMPYSGNSASQNSSGSSSLDNSNTSSLQDANSSSVKEEEKIKPSDLSPTEAISTYLQMKKGLVSFKSVTTGTTKAKVAFTDYVQNANNTTYKSGDEYFQECTSKSTFVNMTHQAFVKGDKVVYRNSSSGNLSVDTKQNYKNVYGVSPDDEAIGGYIVNSKTLLSAEKTKEKDGLYIYKLTLDGQAASANMVKQMKEFGSLNGYPTVHTLTLYLTIAADWSPVKLIVESTYDISIAILGNLSCTHNFTTEFSQVNGSVVIPNANEFKAKL